jgi:hypothetical protein
MMHRCPNLRALAADLAECAEENLEEHLAEQEELAAAARHASGACGRDLSTCAYCVHINRVQFGFECDEDCPACELMDDNGLDCGFPEPDANTSTEG